MEVAEAGTTEVEQGQEAEEDDVGNHVGARQITVQHMEQHPRRPEEPHRRHRE